MKRCGVFLIATIFVLVMAGPCFSAAGLTRGDQTIYGKKTFEHGVVLKGDSELEGSLQGVGLVQYGNIYYVYSGTGHDSAGNYGKTYDQPFATVNYAYDQCSANDIIYVLPNHTETIDAATDIVLDTDGVTIIGLGYGRERPTFSWADDSDATIPVSGADNVLINMVFDGSSTANDGPDDMFNVTAAGFQLLDSEVIIADATEAATLVITGSADADRMKVLRTRFYGTSAETGCSSAITFTGAAEDIEIGWCTFEADFSEAAIDTDQVVTQVDIHDCFIRNYNDDDHAIQFDGNALGVIRNCQLATNAYATALDPGKMEVYEVYWYDDDHPGDNMGVYPLAVGTGAAHLSATDLANIEAEATDAIEADGLDHLMMLDGGTHAYPDSPANESVVAYILSKASTAAASSYDNTTDSLEALSDYATGTTTIAGRTYATKKTGADVSAGCDLFDVDGGAILITSFVGYVTTQIQNQATAVEIVLDADSPYVDHDFSTAVDLDNDAVGTRIVFSDANESVLTELAGEDGGSSILMSPWFCGEGMIESFSGAGSTGEITWYMTWIPYDNGTTVTAQ